MKTIKLLFIGLAVLSMGLFTSCEEDGETTGPSIKFLTGTGITTADATVAAYSDVKFSCLVAKGSADLVSFDIKVDNVSIGGVYPINSVDDIFDKESFTADATDVVAGPGTYTYTFIATDEDGLTDIKTIVITAGTNINTYTGVVLGSISYNTSIGTYFDAINNTIYKYNDADAKKSDFGYLYGTDNGATICAPDWSALTMTQGTGTWTVKKATKFKTTTKTFAEFDLINSDTDILTAADGAAAQFVNYLQVGGANENVDVIAFITAEGKKGLIKIKSFANGTNAAQPQGSGTITIDVKIQK